MTTVCRKLSAMTSPRTPPHADAVTHVEGFATEDHEVARKTGDYFLHGKRETCADQPRTRREAGWIIKPDRNEANYTEQEDGDADALTAPERSFLAVGSGLCCQVAQE